MISYIENSQIIFDYLERYIFSDSFACRIYSMCRSYNPKFQFVDYWIVKDDETQKYTGAILRSGYDLTLFLTDKTNLSEISDFVKILGAKSVLCDGKYKLNHENYELSKGYILFRNDYLENEKHFKIIDLSNLNNQTEYGVKSAYEVIKKSECENFISPDFENFYVDVNHKLRHKTIRLGGVVENNELAGICMTVAETEKSAVIGAVATSPEHRKKGIGFFVVNTIVNELVLENKNVFAYRAEYENIRFYDKLNFKQIGVWNEYKLKE